MLTGRRPGNSWTAVAVTMLALGLAALPIFLLGAQSVQIQTDLGLRAGELGLLFSLFFLVAAFSSATMGRLSERLGSRSALRAAILLSACVLLGIGTLGRSLVTIGIFAAAAGVAGAMVHPASNLLLVRAVPQRRLGLSFGVKQSGIPVATLLGGLAVPAFALTVGWRWGFVAGALLALVVAAVVPQPASSDRFPDRRPAPDELLPRRYLVLLSVGLGCGTAGATSLGAFAIPTMVDAGMSEGIAGIWVAVASVIGVGARISMGLLADRRPGTELRLMVAMMLTGCLGYAVMAAGHRIWMYVAVPLAFGAGWGWLGLFDLAIVRLNRTAPGAATGFTKTGAFLGGIVGPSTLGATLDRWSFGVSWLVAATFAGLAALCVQGVDVARRLRRPPAGSGVQPAPDRRR